MTDRMLLEFVKESIQQKQSREDIANALHKAGWQPDEVRSALDTYTDVDFPIAVPRPRPYLSAREAFLFLFFFFLLGIVSYSFGMLLFGLINNALPDELADNAHWREVASIGQIRSGISGLVVATPVFLFLANLLRKLRKENSALQRSRIRKWLTYLSLVVAGCTVVGDLIALVFTFLSGDLTIKFVLKALVIGSIAGCLFFYLINDAERGDDVDQTI